MTQQPTTETAALDSPRPSRSPIVRLEVASLTLTIACGLGAWAVGLRMLGYDYDEVTRAHSAWLASQGLRPYNDFFECHPPYFALLGPLVRGLAPVDILQTLRGVAAVGNLLFLGGLAALGASLVGTGRRWAWLGLAVVAFHPAVLQYLVEFRIDGWGYALAAWSLYRHRRLAPDRSYRDFEVGILTGIATLLFCPKLTILPALVVAFGQTGSLRTPRRVFRSILAYSAGVGVAVGLFVLFLTSQGIDFGRMFELLVRYHAVSGSNASFHLGLAQGILQQKALAWLTLAGVIAWAIDRLRRKAWPGAYETALFAWLSAQAILVAYPYKQYFAPWFLFASTYLGDLGQGSSTWLGRARMVAFLAACVATGFGTVQSALDWSHQDEARLQEERIRWMNQVAAPEDRVIGSPPLHPIDRLDTFFVWFNTSDPGGFDSERILSRLPTYRENVAPGRFLQELEAHPPAVVAIAGDWRMVSYTAGQVAALSQFLPRRGYRTIQVGPAVFAVRPDRLEQARLAK
ncbi:hypothetical protein SAMN05444166_2782 [Singulisphaera sp. GP187]|uniref:hypothetical protein n=1 Tax=Singulisphaera sp. GP187 TaxID=1882752 RepID=UPI00092C7F5F|nr:hypothetical protein [Singulisphaera sp. GP187]SIO16482.1 hypothetical protein SAMN05444166_2782 [Singulisphaera sp. GP187]